jgi:hypothetical protein
VSSGIFSAGRMLCLPVLWMECSAQEVSPQTAVEVETGRACVWLLCHSSVASRHLPKYLSKPGPRILGLHCLLGPIPRAWTLSRFWSGHASNPALFELQQQEGFSAQLASGIFPVVVPSSSQALSVFS